MINFFEDILNQRPIKVSYLVGVVTLIALGVTLIAPGVTLIGRSKLPSVNKVNIIIVNKNKL